MEKLCNDVAEVVSTKLIPKASSADTQVFYYKMIGDYHRYHAEVAKGEQLASVQKKAAEAYSEAMKKSEEMGPAHPVKLGLVLNLSVFYYEAEKDAKKAILLAKDTFESAISKLDDLPEEDYRDSATVL